MTFQQYRLSSLVYIPTRYITFLNCYEMLHTKHVYFKSELTSYTMLHIESGSRHSSTKVNDRLSLSKQLYYDKNIIFHQCTCIVCIAQVYTTKLLVEPICLWWIILKIWCQNSFWSFYTTWKIYIYELRGT